MLVVAFFFFLDSVQCITLIVSREKKLDFEIIFFLDDVIENDEVRVSPKNGFDV